MFRKDGETIIETERLALTLPSMRDHLEWAELRKRNEEFLRAWEPRRRSDQNHKALFRERVKWAKDSFKQRRALGLLLKHKSGGEILGGVTLDNIRFGPSQAASLGYWLGEEFTGNGFMSEAVKNIVTYAFTKLDISRIEAATLEHNIASLKVLTASGFRYEGVAQAYLQIDGRWQRHVLYANIRRDRLGLTAVGIY